MIRTIVSTDASDQRSFTSPPALWELMGRPVLSYVLDLSDAFSADPAAVVTGSETEQFEEAFPDRTVEWVRSEAYSSFFDAVSRTGDGSDPEHLLFLRGDMPLVRARHMEELIEHHKRTDAAMTILSGAGGRSGFPCRLEGEDREVQSVGREGGDAAEPGEQPDRYASAVALVKQSGLRAVQDQLERSGSNRSDQFLFELARRFLDLGERVELYTGNEPDETKSVSSAEALSEATVILRKRVISLLLEKGVKILSPEHTYIEPDVEIGQGTIIEPFVVIRNGVTVGRDCHLGPFCQLREGTHLEDQAEIGNYVETKNSRVGRQTKAKHLSYLGDATVGDHVNIGAGTITANYDGSEKHHTTIEDHASTGSNTVLIAPVTMKEESKTGAGTVVTRGDDVEKGGTVVGMPAKPLDDS